MSKKECPICLCDCRQFVPCPSCGKAACEPCTLRFCEGKQRARCLFCREEYPILWIEEQKRHVKRALSSLMKKTLLAEDRHKCTRDIEKARNYKHYHDIRSEIRSYPKKRRQYLAAMDILMQEKRMAQRNMLHHGNAMVHSVAKRPILTYLQFRDELSGFSDTRLLKTWFGREDPPVLYGHFEMAQFYEDTSSREEWIHTTIDRRIRDPTSLLHLGKPFLIDFLRTGALDGHEHISSDVERMVNLWQGMTNYLRPLLPGETTPSCAEYMIGVYASMAESIYELRHGHINVDEYIKRVSRCQYMVEMMHARYLHMYEFVYALLDILNDGYHQHKDEEEITVDPERLILAFQTLHDSTRAVQEVGLHMPWLEGIYCCPLPNMGDALWYIERFRRGVSSTRKRRSTVVT